MKGFAGIAMRKIEAPLAELVGLGGACVFGKATHTVSLLAAHSGHAQAQADHAARPSGLRVHAAACAESGWKRM